MSLRPIDIARVWNMKTKRCGFVRACEIIEERARGFLTLRLRKDADLVVQVERIPKPGLLHRLFKKQRVPVDPGLRYRGGPMMERIWLQLAAFDLHGWSPRLIVLSPRVAQAIANAVAEGANGTNSKVTTIEGLPVIVLPWLMEPTALVA